LASKLLLVARVRKWAEARKVGRVKGKAGKVLVKVGKVVAKAMVREVARGKEKGREKVKG